MKGIMRTMALSAALIGMGSGVVTQVEAADHRTKVVDVAHRGASGYAPEHTITSYKMGERLHGDYIEIDLQMTKDGSSLRCMMKL